MQAKSILIILVALVSLGVWGVPIPISPSADSTLRSGRSNSKPSSLTSPAIKKSASSSLPSKSKPTATSSNAYQIRIAFDDSKSPHSLCFRGLDIFDVEGAYASHRATNSSMSSVLDSPSKDDGGYHGPAAIVTSYFDPDSDADMKNDYPCTARSTNPWVAISFPATVELGFLRVWSLEGQLGADGLLGAHVTVIDPTGRLIVDALIQEAKPEYSYILNLEPADAEKSTESAVIGGQDSLPAFLYALHHRAT